MKACFSFKALKQHDISNIIKIEYNSYAKPWSEGMFKGSLSSNDQCIGCWIDKQLIGYFIASLYEDESHILNLCIDKQWQGKGLGNLLLAHLHSHISQLSAKYCFLEVRKSNHIAIQLYQKFNYQIIGIRKNYYPAIEGREDGIVMKKIL